MKKVDPWTWEQAIKGEELIVRCGNCGGTMARLYMDTWCTACLTDLYLVTDNRTHW
ncbi:hypothetical protein [Rhodococcus koreensis]